MSWHIFDNKSIIKESLSAIQKKSDCYMVDIYTENDNFLVTEEDDFVIGMDFITIITESEDDGISIDIINTDKVESIRLKSYRHMKDVTQ